MFKTAIQFDPSRQAVSIQAFVNQTKNIIPVSAILILFREGN